MLENPIIPEKRIYLDYAATTPVDPEVVKVMSPFYSDAFGNPSSLHDFGRQARSAIEQSRALIADVIRARQDEIVFTSGGTEANNAAVKGTAVAMRRQGNHIITTSIEHSSVYEPCLFMKELGFDVTFVGVDTSGMVNPEDIRKAITPKTILISVMHANNEFGTIQPIEEIGRIAREHGVCFHVDMVQTFGHIPIDMSRLPVDLASFSAHKLYGPKGVGGLFAKTGTKIYPIILGGHQENGLRASTHNVPGIVGFGKAAQIAAALMEDEIVTVKKLRDRLIEGLYKSLKPLQFNGHPTKRLSGNVHISLPDVHGDAVLGRLAEAGIACSAGSACSAGNTGSSRVLSSLGMSAVLAGNSLRFSLGRHTRSEDIDRVIMEIAKIVKELRERRKGGRHDG